MNVFLRSHSLDYSLQNGREHVTGEETRAGRGDPIHRMPLVSEWRHFVPNDCRIVHLLCGCNRRRMFSHLPATSVRNRLFGAHDRVQHLLVSVSAHVQRPEPCHKKEDRLSDCFHFNAGHSDQISRGDISLQDRYNEREILRAQVERRIRVPNKQKGCDSVEKAEAGPQGVVRCSIFQRGCADRRKVLVLQTSMVCCDNF